MLNKALIIGILLFGTSFSVSANEIVRWEYETIKQIDLRRFTKDANRLGNEGWELIRVFLNDIQNPKTLRIERFHVGFFKRKKS